MGRPDYKNSQVTPNKKRIHAPVFRRLPTAGPKGLTPCGVPAPYRALLLFRKQNKWYQQGP